MATTSEVTGSTMINEREIVDVLQAQADKSAVHVREVLAKARELKGLNAEDVATLAAISDPELVAELFDTAKKAKETIYGKRLVIFAPLYISNLCKNDCLYCAFRAKNTELKRRALSQEEIENETKVLLRQGHKRVLLVAGEAYPKQGFQYVLDSLRTIYRTRENGADIRRVNVNVAPLSVDDFRALKAEGIGTYQVFQETYHHETYHHVHSSGKKRDYDWRVTAMDRAMEAGIDDVGIGVLFGLYDWRFEVLALMQHIRHLEQKFGVGPHTISVPRMEPAVGSEIAMSPPAPVSDFDFRKLVAILRLAVPYTGIIMSTRETVQMRRETFALGVSQISAGSRTNPNGYSEDEVLDASQFCLNDHRPLDEVIRDVAELGYVPSFCTGCYRLGRTGEDFMDLAKPGEIRKHCDPNAASTFKEYLEDYASPETKEVGETVIRKFIEDMEEFPRARSEAMVERVAEGERDVYC